MFQLVRLSQAGRTSIAPAASGSASSDNSISISTTSSESQAANRRYLRATQSPGSSPARRISSTTVCSRSPPSGGDQAEGEMGPLSSNRNCGRFPHPLSRQAFGRGCRTKVGFAHIRENTRRKLTDSLFTMTPRPESIRSPGQRRPGLSYACFQARNNRACHPRRAYSGPMLSGCQRLERSAVSPLPRAATARLASMTTMARNSIVALCLTAALHRPGISRTTARASSSGHLAISQVTRHDHRTAGEGLRTP
jgi:hypothetical protein